VARLQQVRVEHGVIISFFNDCDLAGRATWMAEELRKGRWSGKGATIFPLEHGLRLLLLNACPDPWVVQSFPS
jgi:hypothetical protein